MTTKNLVATAVPSVNKTLSPITTQTTNTQDEFNTCVVLPTSVAELKVMLKAGIEHYSSNPVKKNDKLNEALASALNLKNSNYLASLLTGDDKVALKALKGIRKSSIATPKDEIALCDAYVDPLGRTMINGTAMDPSLFDEDSEGYNQVRGYRLLSKEKAADHISACLAEKGASKELVESGSMLIAHLNGDASGFLNFPMDDFVFSNLRNGSILPKSRMPEAFEQLCQCALTANALAIKDASLRAYIDADSGHAVIDKVVISPAVFESTPDGNNGVDGYRLMNRLSAAKHFEGIAKTLESENSSSRATQNLVYWLTKDCDVPYVFVSMLPGHQLRIVSPQVYSQRFDQLCQLALAENRKRQ
jgi:hypothetical protein